MGKCPRLLGLSLLCLPLLCPAETPQPQPAAVALSPRPLVRQYDWQSTPVAGEAQLLTLFCRGCGTENPSSDVPLVTLLRDTLGDGSRENDRISSVWLLTYSAPNWGHELLSGVPFFFWSTGGGSSTVRPRDTKPLFDLTQPQHPVTSEISRDIVQWAAFDPLAAYVRSTSRAYRSNGQDNERLHLEEAVSYLRQAPVSDSESGVTRQQLDFVIARLELRKTLLGGLVKQTAAPQVGEEFNFEQERIRSRNWELLRLCAEKTGLIFESVDLAGSTGEYVLLWFPLNGHLTPTGTSLRPIWKLLGIQDPWTDRHLQNWTGPVYERALNADGELLPAGSSGLRSVKLVPLGIYSLTYPKNPLLMVDFRDKLHLRWHEMTQRSINEITAGIIGISHFTNWYYFVAADLYDFVASRHGAATDQAARLDSYSQFRVKLALDRQLDPRLRAQLQAHVNSLSINPLSANPAKELQAAQRRYDLLQAQTQTDGALRARLNKQRRAELAEFGESNASGVTHEVLHAATFGAYNHRVKPNEENLALLDKERRLTYNLTFLDTLAEADTQPEVAYGSSRIRASVVEVGTLLPGIQSPAVRLHAQTVLLKIERLSKDGSIRLDCSQAIASLTRPDPANAAGIATVPRLLSLPGATLDPRK